MSRAHIQVDSKPAMAGQVRFPARTAARLIDTQAGRWQWQFADSGDFTVELTVTVTMLFLRPSRPHELCQWCLFIARSPKKGNEIQRCWRLYEFLCCASNGPDLLIRHVSIISYS